MTTEIKQAIQLYWEQEDESIKSSPGKMAHYILPNGHIEYFNDKEDHINLEPAREFIGSEVLFYQNGNFIDTGVLESIGELHGIPALNVDFIEESNENNGKEE